MRSEDDELRDSCEDGGPSGKDAGETLIGQRNDARAERDRLRAEVERLEHQAENYQNNIVAECSLNRQLMATVRGLQAEVERLRAVRAKDDEVKAIAQKNIELRNALFVQSKRAAELGAEVEARHGAQVGLGQELNRCKDRVAELEQANEELANAACDMTTAHALADKIGELLDAQDLRARVTELERALRDYGSHAMRCAVFRCRPRTARDSGPPMSDPGPCDCGLNAALRDGQRCPERGYHGPCESEEGHDGPHRNGEWTWTKLPKTPLANDADPLHPNGRCTCAGEGRCEWCQKHDPQTCGVDDDDGGWGSA